VDPSAMPLHIHAIQQGEHPTLIFDLSGLAHNRATRDVLNRAFHDALLSAEFSLHA